MKNWPKIYYISQGSSPEKHLENIEKVCRFGCKLVQLRLKDLPENTLRSTAQKALEICQQYGATLIVNDHITVVQSLIEVGLHIGKHDLPMNAAKTKLHNTLIGGTANSIEDCINLSKNGADYIGLGPFSYTETKKNLDPTIGLNGYKEITAKLKSLKINIPIYAIGGINISNIQPLLDIGLTGVAVSGLLTHSTNLEIKDIINHYG